MPLESPLNPATPQAQSISNLFMLVLIIALVILALVIGFITYILIRHRRRPGREEGSQIHGNLKLEILWTAVPFGILAVVLVFTIRTMHSVYPPAGDRQPDLVVIAHQWWWEVRYPGTGAVTANEIHIPTGRQLLLKIESADVIHDFWVPRLARKVDAIPGHPNRLWLQVDKPGVYHGSCNEFCGAGHAWMLLRVVAQSPPDYGRWLQHEAQNAAAPDSGAAVRGAKLFQEKTCASCHAVRGTSADGDVGPDLTHFGSRRTLAAGAGANTPADLARWLGDPDSIKPGSNMPNLQLAPGDVQALVAYLEELR